MADIEKAPQSQAVATENDASSKEMEASTAASALKVLVNYDGDETWTEEEEAKLMKKVDWKLMPILCITYGLQYYDKAMLSQAALFGLRTDLGLSGDRYAYSASIFYLGFIIGAYPAMALAQRFPIERVASGIVTLWGICLLLTIVCKDYQGLYIERFFLGMLESGVSPMFMLIVGMWYKKAEQAWRMGIWYSCTGYVTIFSPLVNYGFGLIGGGVSSWRYMYIFGGSVTILWGIALLFLLPTDPVSAKGFEPREQYILSARLRENNAGIRNRSFKKEQLLELCFDVKFWLIFALAFLSMIANGPISAFVPIIINGFGYSTLNSLLLTIPMGFYGGSIMLVLSYLAYRLKNCRTWLIFGAQCGTIFASLLLWLLPLSAKGGLLFACTILPSIGGGYAVLMGLQIANTAGYTKRSIASSGLYIGYCLGNFVGPLCFKSTDAPRYPMGFLTVVVTNVVGALLIVVYRYVCVWDNKRRDAAGISEGFDHAYADEGDVKNKQFRYIL